MFEDIEVTTKEISRVFKNRTRKTIGYARIISNSRI